jgi:hypothetical protein
MNEIVWMADFGLGGCTRLTDNPPVFGQVEILRRTAKRVVLVKGVQYSGYRTHVDAADVFPTREAAVAAVRDRCIEQARVLRERASGFERAVGVDS